MQHQPASSYDDEIDLFELAQDIWREKVLVIAVTGLISLATLGYVLMVPSVYTYSNQASLKPASLHGYGSLAAAMQADGKQGLQVANELANSNFALLQKNLASSSGQNSFAQQNDLAKDISARVSIPKEAVLRDGTVSSFDLIVTSSKKQELDVALNQYLEFVAELTVQELNSFLAGLGVGQQVSADMLYNLDKPAGANSVQVKPKKKLIMAVGLVLGAMLGVFAALLRSAIRKRQLQQG